MSKFDLEFFNDIQSKYIEVKKLKDKNDELKVIRLLNIIIVIRNDNLNEYELKLLGGSYSVDYELIVHIIDYGMKMIKEMDEMEKSGD